MPAFAFTVGSVGDFLALGDLIVKLGIALYRSGESPKEYEELRRELELLCHVLGKITICKGQQMSEPAALLLKAMQMQVAECQKVIQDFLASRSPSNEGTWNKITWAVRGTNEAAEIRQKINTHREMLSLLLEMYGVSGIQPGYITD